MIPTALLGAALTLAVALVGGKLWGNQAAFAAAGFGLLATAIQLGALALLKPVRGAPLNKFLTRWGAGMGLRVLGIVAIALAAGLDKTHFPPLACALGFLGVLIPLLFYEVRLVR
jgi:hypothetical protein